MWHSSLNKGEKYGLERVQKVALKIILRDQYISYEDALQLCNLKTLSDRRSGLCLSFAKKCLKNEKTLDIFPLNDEVRTTRISEKNKLTKANTDRLASLDIPLYPEAVD